MANPVVSGPAYSTMGLVLNQYKIDMEELTHKLYGLDFLFTMLSRFGVGALKEVERLYHEFREDEIVEATTITTAAAAAGATSIPCVYPACAMYQKKIWCKETGEMFVCDESSTAPLGGSTTPGSIKVRGLTSASGTGITTAIPAGATLVVTTMAQQEGGAIPPYTYTKEVPRYTRVQQLDEIMFQGSDAFLGEQVYGEPERQKQHMKKHLELIRAISLDYYLGTEFIESASTSTTNQNRRGLRGLISWLAANETDYSALPAGSLTLSSIGLKYLETQLTGAQTGEPLLIMGQNLTTTISSWPSATIRTNDPEGKNIKWGLNVQSLTVPWGKQVIHCKFDPLLTPLYGLGDRAFLLHPEHLGGLEMNGRMPNNKLMLHANVQNRSDIHNIIDVETGTRGMIVYGANQLHRSFKGIQ